MTGGLENSQKLPIVTLILPKSKEKKSKKKKKKTVQGLETRQKRKKCKAIRNLFSANNLHPPAFAEM